LWAKPGVKGAPVDREGDGRDQGGAGEAEIVGGDDHSGVVGCGKFGGVGKRRLGAGWVGFNRRYAEEVSAKHANKRESKGAPRL
jgi:hypothetical protein